MPLCKWDNKYSVNNDELDNHHKELFDILNKMYYSCLDVNNRNELHACIDEFIDYTHYHYPLEERIMNKVGYTEIGNHIKEHNSFRNNILNIRYNNIYDRVVMKALIVNIGNKIINHVIVEDKKYAIPQQ